LVEWELLIFPEYLSSPVFREVRFAESFVFCVVNSSRGQLYATFKTEFCYENYLSRLSELGRKQISKLRTSNCKILIETGRWQNISREDRFVICVETELVMNITTSYSAKNEAVFELRQRYIPRYYHLNPNINKMGSMLSLCNVKLLSNIAVFVVKHPVASRE
jgi:hypothetical protein